MKRRYLVSGEVQGVGFRYFTIRVAQKLGIRGWVRNLPDGDVEALGEGTEDQLSRFEAELRRGPAAAIVRNLYTYDVTDEVELSSSFKVR